MRLSDDLMYLFQLESVTLIYQRVSVILIYFAKIDAQPLKHEYWIALFLSFALRAAIVNAINVVAVQNH